MSVVEPQSFSGRDVEFRALIENSPDTISRYDLECRRIYVNPKFVELFGLPAEELLGKTPSAISPIPENLGFESKLREVIRTKNEIIVETEFTTPEGENGWGHLRIVPEFDESGNVISTLAIGRDITERQRLEHKLKTALSKLEQFVDSITELAWIKDDQGRFIMANKVVADAAGVTSGDEMIGKTDFDFFPHDQAQKYIEDDRKVIQEAITLRTEESILTSDGRTLWIETIKNPFRDASGKIVGTIGTARDISDRKAIEKKIEFMAHHDALTGLPNRLLAKDRTEQIISHAKRNKARAALLFIDLDGFKTINDSMGHSVGDALLKSVAARLKAGSRESDTISRQGGDEFLLILSDIAEPTDIVAIAEKLLGELEKSFCVGGHHLSVSASVGIALYPENGETFETLLQSADTAMYKAKESGKNGYCFYTQAMNHNLIGQFKLQNDLKSALHNNEFVLFYQPQIDLAKNRITGGEALIRWCHPQLGMVPPMSFIPIAESSGIIVQIGEWVIHEACAQAALWHKQGMAITVAVNISAIQFKRGNLESVVRNAIASSGINPRFLELELTESILISDAENILKTVRALKGLGIQLSIDDFGTGYSSLSYLKRFAVDKLKIDQSFVRDITKDQEDAVIVRTISQMAQSLNLKTIAEGVENEEVLGVIAEYGCDEVQGYHFAKPLEAAEFEAYFAAFTDNQHLSKECN